MLLRPAALCGLQSNQQAEAAMKNAFTSLALVATISVALLGVSLLSRDGWITVAAPLTADATSYILQKPPVRLCPAGSPVAGGTCPGAGACGGGLGISSISCSTQNGGECDPGDLPCRYSCTLVVTGSQGDQVCVSGSGYTTGDCVTSLKSIPNTGTTTIDVQKEAPCNESRTWKISWFDSAGNFLCCESVSVTCAACE